MTLHLIRDLLCLSVVLFSLSPAFAGGSAAPAPQTNAKPANGLATSSYAKPLWVELSPAQKLALAPLNPEWDRMSELGKKKWLEIANRYATMKPDEQARLQERMRGWVKLTPEQRMAARENFAKSNQLKPEHKSAQWQQYQQLSEEEKKRLASENEKKKSVTNLPADAVKNPKILAPIKIGPKPATAATGTTATAAAVKTTPPVAAPLAVQPASASLPAISPAVPAPASAATVTDAAPASAAASQGPAK
ncbi:DUF3106 domain-containing protein [Undibacterium sp. Ji49W]|uniref:DUF3106 domain-containing protein n=1 Tax=Undibacterium sp. Ji49W TaxID=3413040 RepID=UPI003BF32725